MNSVVTRWNLDPPIPRISSTTDVELAQHLLHYKDRLQEYNTFLSGLVSDKLKQYVRRNILYDGLAPSVNGNLIQIKCYYLFLIC